MKLRDLKNILDSIYDGEMHTHEDDTVVIELKEPSIGYIAHSNIDLVYCGFDWNSGKVIIVPSIQLIRKQNKND